MSVNVERVIPEFHALPWNDKLFAGCALSVSIMCGAAMSCATIGLAFVSGSHVGKMQCAVSIFSPVVLMTGLSGRSSCGKAI